MEGKRLPEDRVDYKIVACPFCKQLLIADTGYKSKSCFHCGRRFDLDERPVLAFAKNAREAREMLAKMKVPLQTKDDIAVGQR